MIISKLLTILGLILEFISVILIMYEAFYGYKKSIERGARTHTQKNIEKRIMATLSICLLIFGMVLQGFAVLID